MGLEQRKTDQAMRALRDSICSLCYSTTSKAHAVAKVCTVNLRTLSAKVHTSAIASCDGRVVKALDLKSNGIFPRRFESCLQRFFFFSFQFI